MSQRERVYTMLEQAGREGVTNGQFVDAQILRYSARIKELRDAGHRIEKHRITDGTFRYQLQPVTQACPAEGPRGAVVESSALRTAESRGSRRGMGVVPQTEPNQRAAAISGRGDQDAQGGGGSRAAAALPTLFELPRSGSAGHYGSEVA